MTSVELESDIPDAGSVTGKPGEHGLLSFMLTAMCSPLICSAGRFESRASSKIRAATGENLQQPPQPQKVAAI
jgi:hypothetical protein